MYLGLKPRFCIVYYLAKYTKLKATVIVFSEQANVAQVYFQQKVFLYFQSGIGYIGVETSSPTQKLDVEG